MKPYQIKNLVVNALIIIFLLSIILIVSLIVLNKIKSNKKVNQVTSYEADDVKIVTDLVSNDKKVLSKEYAYYDYEVEYNISAPFINLDSSDALKTNDEIYDIYDQAIDTYNNCYKITTGEVKSKNDITVCEDSLDYVSYKVNDKYLFIQLTYNYQDNLAVYNPTQYNYLFDLDTGKLLNDNEIYEAFNVTNDQVEETVMNDYKTFAKNNSLKYSDEDYDETKKNIEKEKSIFISTDGILSIIYSAYFDKVSDVPFRPIVTFS